MNIGENEGKTSGKRAKPQSVVATGVATPPIAHDSVVLLAQAIARQPQTVQDFIRSLLTGLEREIG
jgi:hypothetical protein